MSKNGKHYRQGDVLVVRVNEIPKGEWIVQRQQEVTLAYGEVTGHSHTLRNALAYYPQGAAKGTLASYFEVDEATKELTHQEHGAIVMDPGIYENVGQFEYQPGAIQRVTD